MEPFTPALIAFFQNFVQAYNRHAALEESRLQLRALEAQLDHRSDIARIHASVTRDALRSLVDRRIDATQAGFMAIIAIYAEQSRHYMRQHEKYSDLSVAITDPLQATNYQSLISDVNRQLSKIRKDAYQVYAEMNAAIVCIGGTLPPLQTDVRLALGL